MYSFALYVKNSAMKKPAVPSAPLLSALLNYRVVALDINAHLFEVTLTVAEPALDQRVSLPVWIPGSYLVREFSKNLQNLVAQQGRGKLAITQLDKCTWQVACKPGKPLVLTYQIYAHDNSVRTAWLDAERGFFNGTSVCLKVQRQQSGAQRHRQ